MDFEFSGNSYLTERFRENEQIFSEKPVQQCAEQLSGQPTTSTQYAQNPFRQWNPSRCEAFIPVNNETRVPNFSTSTFEQSIWEKPKSIDSAVENIDITSQWPIIPDSQQILSKSYVKVWKHGSGAWDTIPRYILEVGQHMENQLCDIFKEIDQKIKRLENQNASLVTENRIMRSQLDEVIAKMKNPR